MYTKQDKTTGYGDMEECNTCPDMLDTVKIICIEQSIITKSTCALTD